MAPEGTAKLLHGNFSAAPSAAGTSTKRGDGPTFDDMNDRLTILETHFGYVRKDLDELKSGQSEIQKALTDVAIGLAGVGSRLDVQSAEAKTQGAEIRAELAKLPTKNDLWAWKIQYTALGLAMVAIIIGGIIGGLSWVAPAAPAL